MQANRKASELNILAKEHDPHKDLLSKGRRSLFLPKRTLLWDPAAVRYQLGGRRCLPRLDHPVWSEFLWQLWAGPSSCDPGVNYRTVEHPNVQSLKGWWIGINMIRINSKSHINSNVTNSECPSLPHYDGDSYLVCQMRLSMLSHIYDLGQAVIFQFFLHLGWIQTIWKQSCSILTSIHNFNSIRKISREWKRRLQHLVHPDLLLPSCNPWALL